MNQRHLWVVGGNFANLHQRTRFNIEYSLVAEFGDLAKTNEAKQRLDDVLKTLDSSISDGLVETAYRCVSGYFAIDKDIRC